jgi:putative transposase
LHATSVLAVENLAVKNMVKNHKLSKAISDCGWGMFGTMLKYKAEKEGKTYQEVDRFFPSSKTCHICLNQVSSLPLDIRSWTCEHCQTTHDRDINAAVNIKNEALRILSLGTSDTASLRGCQSPEQTSVSFDAIPVDARSPHLLVEKCE